MTSNKTGNGEGPRQRAGKQSVPVPARAGRKPFELGTVYATPGVLAHLAAHGRLPAELLGYHQGCCWGNLDQEDQKANDDALKTGARLLSAYTVEGKKLYVITEAAGSDGLRASSTILMADEY